MRHNAAFYSTENMIVTNPTHQSFFFRSSFRSFAKPPKQVQVVCECILVLRGKKELNWLTAKKMMSEAGFLHSLMQMDCDSISNSQISTVKGNFPKLIKN